MSTDLIASKYRIVREIARSNDVVYEAVDVAMGRRLAVKELLLPANLTGQARTERIERFSREARAAGRLSHPNTVTIFSFEEHAGRYYIAMEFLEGNTLRDELRARAALPEREAVDIALQVLSALSHAHSHGVVHRDVKPDNIHLLPGGLAKLTDFGIARLSEEASLTADGQVFGTPSYMSPEQIVGGAIDHRSDLFSLGVVLYEMLAGRKPFVGDNVVSITYHIMNAEPAPLRGVSYGVELAVRRCLEKRPQGRPASADELRRLLKAGDAPPAMFLPAPGQVSTTSGPLSQASQAQAPPTGVPSAAAQPPAAGPAPCAGPFVTWGPSGAPQGSPSAQSPAFAPHRPGRRLVAGDGARTFATVMAVSMAISAAVVALVLLFIRAFEVHREQRGVRAGQFAASEGRQRVASSDLRGAANELEEVARYGDPRAAREARTSLASIYNRLGTQRFELGDYAGAEWYWRSALSLLPQSRSDRSNNEEQLEAAVRHNLGVLYERYSTGLGGQGDGGFASAPGSTNPAAPGDDTVLQRRMERARQALVEGIRAYDAGQTERARELWQGVIGEAPGTEYARDARRYLDETTTGPGL